MTATNTFDDPAVIERLGAELQRWKGTPFYPRMARHGVGVDCVRFAIAVLQSIGIVGVVSWPRYSVKGGGPELVAAIERRAVAEAGLSMVWKRGQPMPALMPGDLLLADSPVHLALVGPDDEIWQALYPQGVISGHLGDESMARLCAVFRACAGAEAS